MVERSLSMREAPGSIPGLSNNFQCRGELGWRWGQTSNLVRADALEVRFLLCGAFVFTLCNIFFRHFVGHRVTGGTWALQPQMETSESWT